MILRADASPWPSAATGGPARIPAGRMPSAAGVERVLKDAGAPDRARDFVMSCVSRIDDLRPGPGGDPGAVDDVLVEKYGRGEYVDPPIVDGRGVVLDGCLRVASAAAAGHEEIFVLRVGGVLGKAGDDEAPEFDLSTEELLRALAGDVGDESLNLLQDALENGGKLQADALGGFDFDQTDPALLDRVRTRATRLEDVLDETTAEVVRSAIRRGLEAGETEAELTDRLESLGAFGASRAQRIARTEVHGAVMGGAWEAMRQRQVTDKQWVSTADNRTREAHRDAMGQQVPIEEPFQVGGEELMYPGDPEGSPENVIECRCTMLGVRNPTTVEDLADQIDLEDPDGGDLEDDLEEQVREAIREAIEEGEVTHVHMEDVDKLRVRRDSDPDAAEYDADLEVFSVGEEADPRDVADGVREHLVRSVMTQADVDGFYNEVELNDLPVPQRGTRTQGAVDAVAAGVKGDRLEAEDVLGRELTDEEWDVFQLVARQFWVGPGTNAPSPTSRTRKSEQIAGDLCRADDGKFESCGGSGMFGPVAWTSDAAARGRLAALQEKERAALAGFEKMSLKELADRGGSLAIALWRERMNVKLSSSDKEVLGFARGEKGATAKVLSRFRAQEKNLRPEDTDPELRKNLDAVAGRGLGPRMAELEGRFGRLYVLAGMNPPDGGDPPQAEYYGDNIIVYDTGFSVPKAEEDTPLPGAHTADSNMGMAGVLRHEYGHHVEKNLPDSHALRVAREKWQAIKDEADAVDGLRDPEGYEAVRKNAISTYSLSKWGEGFAEAFAVVTSPKYDRSKFSGKTLEFLDAVEEAIR